MRPFLFQLPEGQWISQVAVAIFSIFIGYLVYIIVTALKNSEKLEGKLKWLTVVGGTVIGFAILTLLGVQAQVYPYIMGRPIFSYGVMLGLSFILGWYLTFHFAKKAGFDDKTISNCLMIAIVSSLLGARILFFISNPSLFAFDKFFAFQDGGLVAYGGYLGGIIGSFIYLFLRKKSFWNFADQAAPSLAIGLCLTRIGCFLYGCDYGVPTDSFLGVRFPKWQYEGLDKWIHSGSPAWEHHIEKCYECIQKVGIHAGAALEDGIRFCHNQLGLTDSMIRECQQGGELTQSFPVHPTQLYESTFGFILFVALLFMKRFRKFDGQLFLIFILAYSIFRFFIEFIRDDLQRGSMAGLSTSQIIAVLLVILSVVCWPILLKRKANVELLGIKK